MYKCLLGFVYIIVGLQLHANTWNSFPDNIENSIHNNISKAQPGDTIIINKGIYKEGNIVINKPLYIKGKTGAILDGENKFEVISIKSDHVTIDGIIVRHSGYSSMSDFAGIKIYSCRKVTIINNELYDTRFGIYGEYITNCIISNNKLKAIVPDEVSAGNGIHCWKSDSVQIMHNSIIGHRDGIYFEFVTNSIIVSNISYGNVRYGLHFMFSHNDEYINNVFENNGAGVAVMYSHNVKMYLNHFLQNWGATAYGLLLKEISDSEISLNSFKNNTIAIYMEGATRIHMNKNNIQSNGWALKIQASCMDNVIEENNFQGNTFDVATNGSLSMNKFNSNYWDHYEGYDLKRDGIGDVPYRPVSMYSMIVERSPVSTLLFRSFITSLLDKVEKVLPSLTPLDLTDEYPKMKPYLI